MFILIYVTVDEEKLNDTYIKYELTCSLADGHKEALREMLMNVTVDTRNLIFDYASKSLSANDLTKMIYDTKNYKDIEEISLTNHSNPEKLYNELNGKYDQCTKAHLHMQPINLILTKITSKNLKF